MKGARVEISPFYQSCRTHFGAASIDATNAVSQGALMMGLAIQASRHSGIPDLGFCFLDVDTTILIIWISTHARPHAPFILP